MKLHTVPTTTNSYCTYLATVGESLFIVIVLLRRVFL